MAGDAPYDLYSIDGVVVESLPALVRELLTGDVGVDLSLEAHGHPEREALTGFSCGRDIAERHLHLLATETGELAHVTMVEIYGRIVWQQREVPLAWASLGGRPYGAANVDLFGTPTVWVATPADGDQTVITVRPT